MNLIKNTGLKSAVNRVINMTVGKRGKKTYFSRKKNPMGGMMKVYNPKAVRRNKGFIRPESNSSIPTAIRAKMRHLRRLRK